MAYKRNGISYGYVNPKHAHNSNQQYIDARNVYWTVYNKLAVNQKNSNIEFENSFFYEWVDLDSLKELYKKINGLGEKKIQFRIPRCVCKMDRGATHIELFDIPTITEIKRYQLNNNGDILNEETILSHFYSPNYVENPVDDFPNISSKENNNQIIEQAMLKMDKASSYCVKNNSIHMKYANNFFTKEYALGGSSIVESTIAIFGLFGENKTVLKNLQELQLAKKVIDLNHPQVDRLISFNTKPLTPDEIKKNSKYRYEIIVKAAPFESDSLLKIINIKANLWRKNVFLGEDDFCDATCKYLFADEKKINVKVNFEVINPIKNSEEQEYLVKPYKYSLYQLLRKAMLTIDTQIIDTTKHGLDPIYNENKQDIGIQYPVVVDSYWAEKMKKTTVNDSIFEGRNFLEILLQIGKYLHAIPKLRFANDGTNRYELYFLQLGGTKEQNNDSNKITAYNSKALSEYYTQFDSYVENLFSSQNSVREYLVAKTSVSSYLVNNDTAELQTKYNMLEIIEFEISMDGKNYKSAIDYIFEKSIYDTLPSDPRVRPSKGNCLYYTLGTNKIVGLSYVPPRVAKYENLASLKAICQRVFQLKNNEELKSLDYNRLSFRIKYRTQDSMRLTQFKPNLSDFVKDNAYESYPHNEQFYNQQDKIIDSEKFSGNLWGQLIKAANEMYTCNEYCTPLTEKTVGELILIENEVYYITAIDAEYYNEAILQKVQYSKNFNNFSAITSIPCEPRFYEISERSSIRRETRQFDFFELTDSIENYKASNARYVKDWQEYLKKLIFCENNQNAEIPNYVYVKFMADKFRQHLNTSETNLNISTLFPSCEQDIIKSNEEVYQNMPSADCRGVIVPVLHYPLKNSILFEWDMADNFKAGDSVNTVISEKNETDKNAYYRMQSARYCDVFGGADLMQFNMFKKDKFETITELQRLPFAEEKNGNGKADFIPTEKDCIFGVTGKYAIGLDKDNREAISGNFQIVLLNKAKDNRNGFVLINTIFNQKNAQLKLALYKEVVPIIPQALDMNTENLIKENVSYTLENENDYIKIEIDKQIDITAEELSKVKSLVWYDEANGTKIPYIVKNLAAVADNEKLNPIYIISLYGKGE